MGARTDVVEGVKGTLLTSTTSQLSAELYEQFLLRYTAEMFARVPECKPFFYPFKRILLWGER